MTRKWFIRCDISCICRVTLQQMMQMQEWTLIKTLTGLNAVLYLVDICPVLFHPSNLCMRNVNYGNCNSHKLHRFFVNYTSKYRIVVQAETCVGWFIIDFKLKIWNLQGGLDFEFKNVKRNFPLLHCWNRFSGRNNLRITRFSYIKFSTTKIPSSRWQENCDTNVFHNYFKKGRGIAK